jgi:hypothetical protein
MIEILAADRTDEPLYEWMRHWQVRYSLDFFAVEDTKIGLPAMEFEQ